MSHIRYISNVSCICHISYIICINYVFKYFVNCLKSFKIARITLKIIFFYIFSENGIFFLKFRIFFLKIYKDESFGTSKIKQQTIKQYKIFKGKEYLFRTSK